MDTGLLRRGINMDQQFLAYRKSREPLSGAEWKGVENSLKEREFEAAAKAGFSHIRLCFGRDLLQSRKLPYEFHNRGFDLLFRAVRMIRDRGMAVILDLHEFPAPEFNKEPGLKETFVNFWREMSRRCRDLPSNVFYGLLNEPISYDADLWRALAPEAIRAIRENDAVRPVLVAGDPWGSLDALIEMGNLKLQSVIYDFHFYYPFLFTHQGAGWGDPGMKHVRNVAYPMDRPAFEKAWEEFKKTGEEDWAFKEYERMPDMDGLKRRMEPVVTWAKRENVTLYCGEFGVRKAGAPAELRALWTRDVGTLLEEAGIGWALWAYRSGFDLFDEKDNPEPNLLKALGL